MSLTTEIILVTVFVVLATLLPTYIISKKKQTTHDEWSVASRELPIYVVVGTQFASVIVAARARWQTARVPCQI